MKRQDLIRRLSNVGESSYGHDGRHDSQPVPRHRELTKETGPLNTLLPLKMEGSKPTTESLSGKIKNAMNTARFIYWQDGAQWLGYIEEYPEYMTQGESFEDLQDNLKDLFRDLTRGEISGTRRVGELSLA